MSMEKLYSMADLEAMSDNDQAFLATMKQIFEEEMLLGLDKMKKAFQEADFHTIKIVAHTMKPSIDNLHIYSIKDEVRQLESLAAVNTPLDTLEPLYKKIDTVLREVIVQMKEA